MKFIVALLFIGAVAAQSTTSAPQQHHSGRVLAEALEVRGEHLLSSTKKTLEEIRHTGHGHLVGALEHQVVLVEALVVDLKAQLADKTKVHQPHHVHVIEEDLLHLENQISEEISIIHDVQHHHQHQGLNQTTLLAKAEALVKQGKETLAKSTHAKEASAIEHEIVSIEKFVKEVEAKPAPADLKKEEEKLARHEKTLTQLLEKAAQRNKTHDPKTPKTQGH